MEKLDPELIYDPNVLYVPKVKQLFSIFKEHHHSLSCCSSHNISSSSQRRSPLFGPTDLSEDAPLPSNLSSAGSFGPAVNSYVTQAISHMQLGAINGSHLAQRMRLPSHHEMLKTSGGLMTG